MDIESRIKLITVQFLPFILAVIFHEYAHGKMAKWMGDTTAEDQGRLTLNPWPHVDIMGTLILPLSMMLFNVPVLFGWAKPVPINPTRFKNYRKGLFLVAIAGPLMNFLMAILGALLLCALWRFVPHSFYLFDPLLLMCGALVMVSFALGFFNLIPLPPLDGSRIVESFLSYEATRKYEMLSQYSFFIFIILISTGAFNFLSKPIFFSSIWTLIGSAFLFGLDAQDIQALLQRFFA